MSKTELASYGEKIAQRVGGAVDAAQFSLDMIQKYVLWDEAQVPLQAALSQIAGISVREQCSIVHAFDIYLGKAHMTKLGDAREVGEGALEQRVEVVADASSDADGGVGAGATSDGGSDETESNLEQSASSEAESAQTPEVFIRSLTAPSIAEVYARHIRPEYTRERSSGGDYWCDYWYEDLYKLRVEVRYADAARDLSSLYYIGESGKSGALSSTYYFGRKVAGEWEFPGTQRALVEAHQWPLEKLYVQKAWDDSCQVREYTETDGFRTIDARTWDENGLLTKASGTKNQGK